MFSFDTTIHLSDLVLFVGILWGGGKVGLKVRDALRDMASAIGKSSPPSGLVGDVNDLRTVQGRHHEWLVELRANRGRHIAS